MLGLGRASQYARWWSSGAPSMRTTVITTATQTNKFPVVPRYYIDFSTITNTSQQIYRNLDAPSGSRNYDMTGITNNSACSVFTQTFKLGTGFYSGITSGFHDGFAFEENWNNNGSNYNYRLLINYNNQLQISFGNGTFPTMTLTNAQLAAMRGKWYAFIIATSDSTSTFAGWSPTNSGSWPARQMLVDIESGTIIKQQDVYGNSVYSLDLTQAWEYGGGTYYNLKSITTFSNVVTEGTRDIQWASDASYMGGTFDPVTYWPLCVGAAPLITVAGVQAWNISSMPVAPSSSSGANGVYEYYETIGSQGARQPAASQLYTGVPQTDNPCNPPVLIQF